MATFEVVFQGQVQPGLDPVQVRARVGQLFQVDQRQLEMLFSGRRIVIKGGLDVAAAQRYQQAIERAGARCEVRASAAQQIDAPAAPVASPTVAPVSEISRSPLPRDEFMAAFVDVRAPDLPLAELGADMQDSYPDYAPLDIDLSAFSLAPVGSDLEQLPSPPPPPAPDTSYLRLAE